jgi:hypothetical protein
MATITDDRIEVTELPLPMQAAEKLPLVYYSHGYDEGYKQAVNDLLKALLPLSESFLATHPGKAEEIRRVLYSFEHYLEERINTMTPDRDFVDGGLGI